MAFGMWSNYRQTEDRGRRHDVFDVALSRGKLVGADLSAKRPVHPTNIHRLNYSIRGQVRSYKKIAFLQ